MVDLLLDDVMALLDRGFGDDRILKQICRACERNEVISNYERNYVRELAEKYLGKKPESPNEPESPKTHVVNSDRMTSDVLSSDAQSTQKTQEFRTETSGISYVKPKNRKLIVGMGSVIGLAILFAVAMSFTGIDGGDVVVEVSESDDSPMVSLSVQTDLTSYAKKDLISISGFSDTSGTVLLSIENTDGNVVWDEQVSIKADGQFSTLTIAGGAGWEHSGIYTVRVDDDVEMNSIVFSFTG